MAMRISSAAFCGLRNIVSFAKLERMFSIGDDRLIFTLFFVVDIILVYQNGDTCVKWCFFISSLFHPPASPSLASAGAVKIFMDIAELFVRHMGVDLGGGDIGVAEEGLDGTEVGAV